MVFVSFSVASCWFTFAFFWISSWAKNARICKNAPPQVTASYQPFDRQIVVDCFLAFKPIRQAKNLFSCTSSTSFLTVPTVNLNPDANIVLPKNLSQKMAILNHWTGMPYIHKSRERSWNSWKKPYEQWIYVSTDIWKIAWFAWVSWVGACSISSHMQMTQLYGRSQIRCWVSTWL